MPEESRFVVPVEALADETLCRAPDGERLEGEAVRPLAVDMLKDSALPHLRPDLGSEEVLLDHVVRALYHGGEESSDTTTFNSPNRPESSEYRSPVSKVISHDMIVPIRIKPGLDRFPFSSNWTTVSVPESVEVKSRFM